MKTIKLELFCDLLTVTEASAVLRLKPSTIRSWILKRRVPFVKLGRLVFLERSALSALIKSSTVPSKPQAILSLEGL